MYASEDVDPAIEGLVASVQQQLPLLQKQALQLSDGMEVRAMTAGVVRTQLPEFVMCFLHLLL